MRNLKQRLDRSHYCAKQQCPSGFGIGMSPESPSSNIGHGSQGAIQSKIVIKQEDPSWSDSSGMIVCEPILMTENRSRKLTSNIKQGFDRRPMTPYTPHFGD